MPDLPMLHNARSWRGRWWLPDQPQDAASGFLNYEPDSGLELVLVGGFDDSIKVPVARGVVDVHPGSGTFPVVQGEAGGRYFTLFDCVAKNSRTYLGMAPMEGPSEQTLRVGVALDGANIKDKSDRVFSSFTCGIEDPYQWSDDPNISRRFPNSVTNGKMSCEPAVFQHNAEKRVARLPWGTVELGLHRILPSSLLTRAGERVHLADYPLLKLRGDEAMSMTEGMEQLYVLRDLVALATGRASSWLWIQAGIGLGGDGGVADGPMREYQSNLYFSHEVVGSADQEVQNSDSLLFTLSDLDFSTLLPQWWEVRDKFNASCNMIIGSRYIADHYLETMLIVAAAGAEAFHGSLKEEPRESRDQKLARLEPAKDSLSDSEWKWLVGMVSHGWSLKQRLERLADLLPESCRNTLVPDPEAWARTTVQARNNLSHSGATKISPDKIYAATRVTRAVVLTHLLLKVGLDEAGVLRALHNTRELRRACALAAEEFPASASSDDR